MQFKSGNCACRSADRKDGANNSPAKEACSSGQGIAGLPILVRAEFAANASMFK